MPVLHENIPPGEKLLRYVGAFFDFLAGHPDYREMVQREMFNMPRRPHAQRVVKAHMRPMFEELLKLFREGIEKGIFRPVDPLQFIPTMSDVVVHYFGAVPILKLMMTQDPQSPERVAARRAAVLDFISAALFQPTALPVEGESK